MDFEEKIKSEFSDKILSYEHDKFFRHYITVDNANLIDIANFVKHDLGFTLVNMCLGTDLKDKMEVIWYIGKPNIPDLIALKVHVDRENPTVSSLTNIWSGLDWHERETYDLVGINFDQHPDLRRLLMPDNWEGHPLREDYVYRKPKYKKPEDY
jgi:NADH-quinone oxidoreductase subunit C